VKAENVDEWLENPDSSTFDAWVCVHCATIYAAALYWSAMTFFYPNPKPNPNPNPNPYPNLTRTRTPTLTPRQTLTLTLSPYPYP